MTLRSQGMEQAKEGDYEAAVASYDEALGLSDMYVGNLEMDIAAYKASALYAEENTEDAIAVCSAVLDVKKSQEMYLTRGLLYRAAENREAANADFASAMGMTSKNYAGKTLLLYGGLYQCKVLFGDCSKRGKYGRNLLAGAALQ